MWKADIPVQNLCLCAVSVMCFLHGYILLVILSELFKLQLHGQRSVRGCIHVSWYIKTIVEVENMIALFQCLFPLNILPSKLSFCSKHDLKDTFELMDVMQGSYTVLAHVGGPLCPSYMHTRVQVKSYRVKVCLDPLHFICV